MKNSIESIFVSGIVLLLFACSDVKDRSLAENTIPESQRMSKILLDVGLGKLDPDSVLLTSSQIQIIDSLISISPDGYNVVQKSIGRPQPELKRLEKLLTKVGLGTVNPSQVTLTLTQRKTIDSIISIKPDSYNAAQKKLGNQR